MQKIRFLVMDVDGTLTNGKIYMGQDGELMKAFDIKDGCGIKDILPLLGITPVIITARTSNIVTNRCKELGIEELYQGERNKLHCLETILTKFSDIDNYCYTLKNVAYAGDDILDLKCMLPVKTTGGLVACPSDAVPEVIDVADFVSTKKGGEGAIREFIEWIKSQMV